MEDGSRVSFDLDNIFTLLNTGLQFVLSIFKPLLAFITRVAGQGPVGFLIIFVIFFSIWLLRMNARSQRADVFAGGLHYIGQRGVGAGAVYIVVLAVDAVLVPLLVTLVYLAYNSATGADPSFSQFLSFMESGTPSRVSFVGELMAFMSTRPSFLPLGFQSAMLVTAAFGCMWLVGKALSPR